MKRQKVQEEKTWRGGIGEFFGQKLKYEGKVSFGATDEIGRNRA